MQSKDDIRAARENVYRQLRAQGMDKNLAKTTAYDAVREAVQRLSK